MTPESSMKAMHTQVGAERRAEKFQDLALKEMFA